jgi:hypothetical protein
MRLSGERCANVGAGKNVAAFPEGGCCRVGLGLILHAP